jgi:hypothetical protein
LEGDREKSNSLIVLTQLCKKYNIRRIKTMPAAVKNRYEYGRDVRDL